MKPMAWRFTSLWGRGLNRAEPEGAFRRVWPWFAQAAAWTESRCAARSSGAAGRQGTFPQGPIGASRRPQSKGGAPAWPLCNRITAAKRLRRLSGRRNIRDYENRAGVRLWSPRKSGGHADGGRRSRNGKPGTATAIVPDRGRWYPMTDGRTTRRSRREGFESIMHCARKAYRHAIGTFPKLASAFVFYVRF